MIVGRTISSKNVSVDLVFEWFGGPYIEVAQRGFRAVEVVNVWDYEKGEASIPFTRGAMGRAVEDWIIDYNEDEPATRVKRQRGNDGFECASLVHDVTENWRS